MNQKIFVVKPIAPLVVIWRTYVYVLVDFELAQLAENTLQHGNFKSYSNDLEI